MKVTSLFVYNRPYSEKGSNAQIINPDENSLWQDRFSTLRVKGTSLSRQDVYDGVQYYQPVKYRAADDSNKHNEKRLEIVGAK